MSSTIIPCFRYHNANEMIEWLCQHFGFSKHAVYNDGLRVMHAQLIRGGQHMIMLGSYMPEDKITRQSAPPSEVGGFNTMACYLIEPQVDALYERLLEAGVEIIVPIEDRFYGGRDFTCKDPEGYIWNFGSYNPWAITAV